MSLPIMVFSPLPAGLDVTKDWGENDTRYDSGEHQADTPFVRPLLIWSIPIKLMTELKEQPLWDFVDSVRGMTRPFLMKDAYRYQVASVLGVRSGITNAATLFLFDTNSYFLRADTTTVGSFFSALSGYVRNGHEYSYDQDSGLLTVNTKALTDVWGVRSMEYFRKAKFSSQYKENSTLWNIWATNLDVVELP